MKIIEKVLVFLSMIGIGLRLFSIEGGVLFSTLFFVSLSLFYLFFATFLLNDIRLASVFQKRNSSLMKLKRILWSVGIGISFSIHLMGLLFLLNNWPGAMLMLKTGVVLLSIISIISLIKYLLNSSKFHVRVLIRCGALIIAIIFCI